MTTEHQALHPLAGTPFGTVVRGRPGVAAATPAPEYYLATEKDADRKHGPGKTGGRLGHDLTLREALRNVTWTWMAAHREQQVAHLRGQARALDFPGRLNTLMAGAVHAQLDGRPADHAAVGFLPHTHKAPLATAHAVLREAAGRMGLRGDHELLPHDRRVPTANSPAVTEHETAKEPMRKMETLMKRSKNVRQQVRNITPGQAQQRRTQYAQSIGLKPVDDTGDSRFPQAKGNRLPVSPFFSVEHETAHAMMTPPGQTIRQYQNHLSAHADARKPTPDEEDDWQGDEEHAETQHHENIANQAENLIDRRAGVDPSKFRSEFRTLPVSPKDVDNDYDETGPTDEDATARARAAAAVEGRPAPTGIPHEDIRDEARAVVRDFDNGARFDPTGRIQRRPDTGATLDQRINLAAGPGNPRLRALLAVSKARRAVPEPQLQKP